MGPGGTRFRWRRLAGGTNQGSGGPPTVGSPTRPGRTRGHPLPTSGTTGQPKRRGAHALSTFQSQRVGGRGPSWGPFQSTAGRASPMPRWVHLAASSTRSARSSRMGDPRMTLGPARFVLMPAGFEAGPRRLEAMAPRTRSSFWARRGPTMFWTLGRVRRGRRHVDVSARSRATCGCAFPAGPPCRSELAEKPLRGPCSGVSVLGGLRPVGDLAGGHLQPRPRARRKAPARSATPLHGHRGPRSSTCHDGPVCQPGGSRRGRHPRAHNVIERATYKRPGTPTARGHGGTGLFPTRADLGPASTRTGYLKHRRIARRT